MQINVAQQLRSAIGTVKEHDVDVVMDVTGDGNTSWLQGKVSLTRTDRGILFNGVLKTDVELACSRCLSPFPCPLTLKIAEEYFPTVDVVSGVPLPLPDEFGCFTIDENHELDLTDAVHQYALLAIPMKPLCRQDCAGLCPVCGQNLNLGECNCLPPEADPRWAKLKQIGFSQ
ncbi:MAG: DUF177 domain-containing protein [Dehalococcoidales bacterium]|jgi:uncharacterized protein|nr:DUF177 domain-containing protein [Dehalococcoidales bacterium]